MSLSLSSRQLAKLRELARVSNELQLRHAARREAFHTQREYLVTLNRQLEDLDKRHGAAINDARTPEQSDAIWAKHEQSTRRLQEQIRGARGELEQLQEQLSQLTATSAPLRELVGRVLSHAGLTRREAGVAFGDDDPRPREVIDIDGPPPRRHKSSTATPSGST